MTWKLSSAVHHLEHLVRLAAPVAGHLAFHQNLTKTKSSKELNDVGSDDG